MQRGGLFTDRLGRNDHGDSSEEDSVRQTAGRGENEARYATCGSI
jgi:hypothetical protein